MRIKSLRKCPVFIDHYTLVRSIQGGDFKRYNGCVKSPSSDLDYQIMAPKKGTKKRPSLTDFILDKLSLTNKKLKINADNKLVSYTLRNSAPLFIINEKEIQKESSPFISEQYTKITEDTSKLKLLLTGTDDSALLPAEVEKVAVSRTAKITLLEELINGLNLKLDETQDKKQIEEQLIKLTSTIDTITEKLDENKDTYNKLVNSKKLLREKLDVKNNRISEIKEMLTRFKLLKAQYLSDISRLDNISEAGTLYSGLPSGPCTMCGNDNPSSLHITSCDEKLENVVIAASSEKDKIINLSQNLNTTIDALQPEKDSIEIEVGKVASNLNELELKTSNLNKKLDLGKTSFQNVLNLRSKIEATIEVYNQKELLETKKTKLENSKKPKISASKQDEPIMPTNALYKLSTIVNDFLKSWNFDNTQNVHFDKDKNDFVINGKHRASNGKGYRAITHAAATLGLMKFTEQNKLPHLGFVILDSPLLAYEEPDSEEDDLSATDVNVKFFESISSWTSKQIIIFENKKSIPQKFSKGDQIIEFTKKVDHDRFGFFPTENKTST
jgi:hypothetical protein